MKYFVQLEEGDRHAWGQGGYVWVVRKAYFDSGFDNNLKASMYKSKEPNAKIVDDGMLEIDGTEYGLPLNLFEWQIFNKKKRRKSAKTD